MRPAVLAFGAAALFVCACSFDYGAAAEGEERPDLVMDGLEYVRVRDGVPQVFIRADRASRYEERRSMSVEGLSFEQYDAADGSVAAKGSAAAGRFDLASGDAELDGNIRIEAESEDYRIQANRLRWDDEGRRLSGGESDAVRISRSDGTHLEGTGFSADLRSRTWTFTGPSEGVYVEKDEAEAGAAAPAAADGAAPGTPTADGAVPASALTETAGQP